MQDTLHHLVQGLTLSEQQADAAFESIFQGRANEAQVGAMLAFIAQRGPTIDELVGGATAMRRHATPILTAGLESQGVVIDTCGTGGAVKTFNVSTAAALVVAAAKSPVRIFVAKHGGRSRTGRGSAEILEHLGVNIAAPPDNQRRCLEEAGVCFAFAVHHHPAMRFAAAPRKSLGFPTIFNLLGPLTNPAGAAHQLIGVYDRAFVEPLAEALRRLGCRRAMVAHGLEGIDELSITGPTLIAELRDGRVTTRTLDAPAELGIPRARLADLQQATYLDSAADLLRRILAGEQGPPRDIVTLNAAAALVVAGAAPDLGEGHRLAGESIDSGRAAAALESLVRVSAQRSAPSR